jgi:hypothetical protein
MFFKQLITMLALFVAFITTTSMAKAGPRALISLHDNGPLTWDQRVSLQSSLRERFGFEETRFLVDATPDEVPAAVKQFLEEAPDENDHRLVWVSGLNRRHARSICPDASFAPIQPTAPSLILAPACYGDALILPQGTRHFSLTAPDASSSAARIGRTRATDTPWVALLSLPGDGKRFIQGADRMIAEHLSKAPVRTLDASNLLHLLRAQFRWNGSSYTPSLDVFDRGIDRDQLYPFAIDHRRRQISSNHQGRRVEMRGNSLALFDRPTPKRGPGIVLDRHESVRLLRQGRDQSMRFVVVDNRYYGWVKTDDLAF